MGAMILVILNNAVLVNEIITVNIVDVAVSIVIDTIAAFVAAIRVDPGFARVDPEKRWIDVFVVEVYP